MKVFISWSGAQSQKIARELSGWISRVIQAAKPFFSPDDISKGTRWNNDISHQLENTKIGIICLTPDSLQSQWIMFEAGALSKNVESAKVCPILFNVDYSQTPSPLIQFQAAKFSREEMWKVISMINEELRESKLPMINLQEQFDIWWPKLEDSVSLILSEGVIELKPSKRAEKDILEEILTLTRSIAISYAKGTEGGSHELEETVDLLISYYKTSIHIALQSNDIALIDTLKFMYEPLTILMIKTVSAQRKQPLDTILKALGRKIIDKLNNVEVQNESGKK